MEIGEYIRQKREAAGLSLRKLAGAARMNAAYLSRVESGKVRPSDAFLRRISKILRTRVEELLLLAGQVPSSWQKAIAASPARAAETLRDALAKCIAEPAASYTPMPVAFAGTRAIEDTGFPFESLSDIAELESWRKEVHRPIYHIHKWWAQRLGAVFRAIILGAFAPKGSNLLEMFYQPVRLSGAVVFDPFMGSGTTIGEAIKVGARAIGRDINPVSHFIVRNALGVHSRPRVIDTFQAIERDVAPSIRHFYHARLANGATADVLYYFWVKVVPCPQCAQPVDLFSSYVFAQHAYPARFPEARALCPGCGSINAVRFDQERATCSSCGRTYAPQQGPAKGVNATCPACGHSFPIARTVRQRGNSPDHRLYAKMVLHRNGTKEYLPSDDYDLRLYREAASLLSKRKEPYPVVPIEPGYNTNQVLNYCYSHWHQMFNDRQLLCLSLLAERIRAIPDERIRRLFACLLSGTLEFNNMFASFKGEGTGAVRHMFSHHILKPERTPLEANIWGTPKSSGAFSTLFESRILRALDYAENPFEIRVMRTNGKATGEKVFGLSTPLGTDAASSFEEFEQGRSLYLSTGDSSKTDLANACADAVITDPPFFDNVHYSQLADFFYVWQRHILQDGVNSSAKSTRSEAEVQNCDPALFTERLEGVFKECNRVLRPNGLLVFTYHHSRSEGWSCILEAVRKAGFAIVAAHPIKAEMSVAAPKQQAKEPIDLDVILACRKSDGISRTVCRPSTLIREATQEAAEQVSRFNNGGRRLGRNDVRVVLMAQVIKRLSWEQSVSESIRFLGVHEESLETAISRLNEGQEVRKKQTSNPNRQLALW